MQRLDPARDPEGPVTQRIQWETDIGGAYLENMSGLRSADLVATLKPLSYFRTMDAKVRGMRVDVLMIGPDAASPATNPVGILEVKGDWAGGEAAAVTQAAGYVAALKLAGWSNTSAPDSSGYVDTFRMVYQCVDGSKTYDDYSVTGKPAGAVVVAKTASQTCVDGKAQPVRASSIEDVEIPVEDVIDAPAPTFRDPLFDRDFRVNLAVGVGIAGAATGADAAVRYLTDRNAGRTLVRQTEQYLAKTAAEKIATRATARSVAFAEARDAICLGPVNAATRGPGDGSVSAAALTCTEAANASALVAILAGLDVRLDADALADLGLTEEDARAMGLTTSPARVRADPHLITLDGLNYDFHGVGEYILVDHAVSGLQVQMRTVPAQNDMSSVGALAIGTGGMRIELDANGTVLIDGQGIELEGGGTSYFGNGVLLSRTNGVVSLLTAFDDDSQQALITWTPRAGDRGDFSLAVPRVWAGQLTGMLGNFDGNPRNDLVSAAGIDVSNALNFGTSSSVYRQRLYATFGDSWRVTDDSTLFAYPTGSSTGDYADRARPYGVVSLANLSDEALANARTICAAAGITEGLSLNDCLLDVGSSGDASFAASLAARDSYGVSVDDAPLGSDPLSVTFDGAVPPNFFPAHLHSRGSAANYAGPFSGTDGYSFYVNDLPGHRSLSVATTVVIPEGDDAAGLKLLADDQSYWPSTTGDAQAITLPDGRSAQLVPLTFSVPHRGRQVQASILSGSGTAPGWFGIDSITLDADRVPYQQFDIDLVNLGSAAVG